MDAAHFEKTLTSEVLFEGRVVTLTKDTALLENGKTATREVVHHHGGACIVPYFEDGTICMVRQFRYAMQQELWELPAGKLDPGEDHRPAALRELSEETGLEAEEYTYLGHILASPGFCDESLHMYLARGLKRSAQHPDEDEFLDVVTMPFDQLLEQVMDGSIEDAKTVAGVLKTKVLLNL